MSTDLFTNDRDLKLQKITNPADFFISMLEMIDDFYIDDMKDLSLNQCASKTVLLSRKDDEIISEENSTAFVVGNDKLGVISAQSCEGVNNFALSSLIAFFINNIDMIKAMQNVFQSAEVITNKKCVLYNINTKKYWGGDKKDFVDDIKDAEPMKYREAVAVCMYSNGENLHDVIVPVDGICYV